MPVSLVSVRAQDGSIGRFFSSLRERDFAEEIARRLCRLGDVNATVGAGVAAFPRDVAEAGAVTT